MNKFELRYSTQFYNDLNKIIIYIQYKLKNNIAANNFINKVENKIKERAKSPLSYEKYYSKAGEIYYRIYIYNYVIFYTVNNNIMELRRILYNKRNIKKLL